ncbi:MAG: GTPase Era [Elusimicrobia bacterium]|nr:GTPase Era [Elusimicrobiota bacterium]
MIFVDTPGWLSPQDVFQSFMKRAIVRSIYDDADVLLWMLEPKPFNEEDALFANKLKKSGKPVVVIVNKMDLAGSSHHFDRIKSEIQTHMGPDAVLLPIAAKQGAGLTELKSLLVTRLPEGPAFFPADQITDRWERFYVAELIREQIFKKYQEEVPHACLVTVDEFSERPGRKDHIRASIVVESESQKKIMIGAHARAIKDLGQAARKEIEAQLNRPIYLELEVKVKKNWRQDPAFLKLALGQSA